MGHFQRLALARESVGAGRKSGHGDEAAAPAGAFLCAPILQGPGAALERASKLGDALDMLLEAEALSRTTAVPGEAVCGRALMNIAAMAKGRMLMLKVRVIPCLDVKDGRVVKGVNFERPARCRRSGRAGDHL